nr:hypothetical protein [Tanacetum cinerariifolium]
MLYLPPSSSQDKFHLIAHLGYTLIGHFLCTHQRRWYGHRMYFHQLLMRIFEYTTSLSRNRCRSSSQPPPSPSSSSPSSPPAMIPPRKRFKMTSPYPDTIAKATTLAPHKRGRLSAVGGGFSLHSEIETLHIDLGAARERISDLEFRLGDTKTRLDASEAREIRLGALVRALEDRLNHLERDTYKANPNRGNGVNNETCGSARGSVFYNCICVENSQVEYASCTLLEDALTWRNAYVQEVRLDAAYETAWNEMKQMMIDEYYPRNEELALLCPTMVKPEYKNIKRYIYGLTDDIQGNVTSSKPTKIQEAFRIAHALID